MRGRGNLRVGLLVAACALASPASAAPVVAALPDPGAILLANLRPGSVGNAYLADLLRQLAAMDEDGNGLDSADVARKEQGLAERRRARRERERQELTRQLAAADTNRDGGLSIDEMAALDSKPASDEARLRRWFAAQDSNRDGRLSGEEIVPPLRSDAAPLAKRAAAFARLFALDPDGGRLTAANLEAVFRPRFAALDSDGDGTLSAAEHRAGKDRLTAARLLAAAPVCPVPPVPRHARVVAFAAGDGAATSPVAVGGQDMATRVIDVRIEPGREPLFVVLSAVEPVIWNVSGDTRRVARLVLSGWTNGSDSQIAAGAAGVPAGRTSFAPRGCLTMPLGEQGSQAFASALAAAGLPATAEQANGTVAEVALPSLAYARAESRAQPAPPGFAEAEWQGALRFTPRGIAALSAPEVHAPSPAQDYAVLPQWMGLAQLVASGALVPSAQYTREFLITRPFPRFPAGLFGAHSVNFVLPDGMAMPAGRPGHGCVYAPDGREIGQMQSCMRLPLADLQPQPVEEAPPPLADPATMEPFVAPPHVMEPIPAPVDLIPAREYSGF